MVLVERLAGPSEAGIFYLVAMAVLVLSSSLASSSVPLMVSGGGNLAVEGARVAAGLTSLAVALAAPLSPLLFPLLGRGFSPGPLALALAAPAAVEVALVSAASARCNAEGRWRELAALGLAGSLPLAALCALLPRLLPGAGSRSRWACCRPARSHCAWWAAALSRRSRSRCSTFSCSTSSTS